MYIFITSIKQTLKLFLTSFICSALFVKFYDASYSVPLTSFILLLAPMLLFLFVCNRMYFSLHDNAEFSSEYIVPAAVSLSLYIGTAFTLYSMELRTAYNWLFLPTRFLAPLYPTATAYAISFLFLFVVIARIPIISYYSAKKYSIESDEYGNETLPGFSPFMDVVSSIVYIIGNMLKYTVALLIVSIICSVIFANRFVDLYTKPLVYTTFITVSLILFLFVCHKLFSYLCIHTQSILEHVIPTLFACLVYSVLSWILYTYRVSTIYNWLFLPTRFIEPVLPKDKVGISYLISYILLFIVMIRIPIQKYIYLRHMEYEESLRREDAEQL